MRDRTPSHIFSFSFNGVLLFVTHFVEFKCRVFVRVLCIQRMALFLHCYTSFDCPYGKKKKKYNLVKQILIRLQNSAGSMYC